jgi:hypothetical protein
MRYLRHSFEHPIVRAQDQAALPSKRLAQARSSKLIVAGMTKVLECVIDRAGDYLAAKSTTIVLPQPGVNLDYLGALLNSQLMTLLFRAMFGGLSLQGGYLRVGPPQLEQLPMPVIAKDRRPTVAAIGKQVCELEATLAAIAERNLPHERDELSRRAQTLRARIDAQVCELYGLSEAQTRAVLAH